MSGRRATLGQRTLILVMGVAGSGKTTIAQNLLERIWAVYLDNNFIVDSFYPDTRNDSDYLTLRPRFYRALYRIAEENLLLGNSIILDAPHIRQVQDPSWCRFLGELAARTRSNLAAVRCACSEATLRQRLSQRGEARDLWKLRHWADYLEEQPPKVEIPFDHLELDTDGSLDANVALAVDYVMSVGNSAAPAV